MSLKEKLNTKSLTIGSWITIGHPSVAEILASAGFEWLVIDMEHTSIDYYQTHILISVIQGLGLQALVRVGENSELIIKRALDMGADGIIVPMVTNEKDATKAVSACRYSPEGVRGVGLFRAQKYGIGFEEYKEHKLKDIVVIAQIEHINALKNIEAIGSVDGIDGLIIGPYDLSSSMGYPGEYDRDDVQNVISEVQKKSRDIGISFGFHVIESDPEQILKKINQGCNFLAYSIDFFFLGDTARNGLKIIRRSIGSN